ncbi:MAG: ThiF family adenylyltransferase [Candidatus Xenobiia bacterium LiM19]
MIDWFDQEKMGETSVIVAGAGATGNEVLKNLSLLGIGRIHIVDFDRIEEHNLTRTVLFNERDIGRYKAEVAAEACLQIDPSIEVSHRSGSLWESLSIGQIKSFDAVFCCVDNHEARIRLNELCLWAQVDFYNLAIDSRYVAVEKYPFSSDRGCACYQCNLPASVYKGIRERYSCGWLRKKAFEEKKVPTTAITAGIAGAFACSLFLQRDHKDSPQGSLRMYIDTISLNTTVAYLAHQEKCLCSRIYFDYLYFKVKNKPVRVPPMLCNGVEKDFPVYLSDKVVLDVICRNCGTIRTINGNAEKYDESLAHCSNCNAFSNDVVIKDNLTFEELSDRFSEVVLPVKFLYFYEGDHQVLLEMEA